MAGPQPLTRCAEGPSHTRKGCVTIASAARFICPASWSVCSTALDMRSCRTCLGRARRSGRLEWAQCLIW